MVCCTLSKCRWHLFLDIFIAVITLTLFFLIEFGIIPNQKSGFYCGDPNLNHINRGSTVSAGLLIGGSIFIPLILMFLVEYISSYYTCHPDEDSLNSQSTRLKKCGKLTLFWYREFMLGLCVVFFITDAIKVIIGEPRPHFLDSCKPDKAFDCVPGTYIENYQCTNTKIKSKWALHDLNMSFPSGHASVSFYTSIFLMAFIKRRIMFGQSWLFLPWLQLICSMWGIICSFTRITDHQHHWWDVLTGLIIGIIVGIYTVKQFCKSFCLNNDISAGGSNNLPVSSNHVSSPSQWKEQKSEEGSDGAVQRRLLSSSSSYSNSIIEDRELREVNMS